MPLTQATIETTETEARINYNICNDIVILLGKLDEKNTENLDHENLVHQLKTARIALVDALSALAHHDLDLQAEAIKERKEALQKGFEEKRLLEVYRTKI